MKRLKHDSNMCYHELRPGALTIRHFLKKIGLDISCNMVNILKFHTPRFLIKCHEQIVQTQIRLLLLEQSDQGLHCLQFN